MSFHLQRLLCQSLAPCCHPFTPCGTGVNVACLYWVSLRRLTPGVKHLRIGHSVSGTDAGAWQQEEVGWLLPVMWVKPKSFQVKAPLQAYHFM